VRSSLHMAELGTHARVAPAHPRAGRVAYAVAYRALTGWARLRGFAPADGAEARARCRGLRARLARGETVHLVGLGAGGHDAGAALVEASARDGVRLLASHEEERFAGVRHYAGAPERSLHALRRDLGDLGLGARDVHAVTASFDYVQMFARGAESLVQELPGGVRLAHPDVYPDSIGPLWGGLRAARLVRRTLGAGAATPVLGRRHHPSHAHFAWALSPWAHAAEPVLVLVVDGHGDDCAISAHLGREGRLHALGGNESFWDSLGHFYAFTSSAFGGWPIHVAEGRWMAAAAFGETRRETNPFYPAVRALLVLGRDGSVRVDRRRARWHQAGARGPFAPAFLEELEAAMDGALRGRLGRDGAAPPSPRFGYGDAPPPVAQLAAAVQLVFEDALAHLVAHWIRRTGAERLILTGGTALNCRANLALLERFDGDWYERALGRSGARLRVWVPPAPADEGTIAGSAIGLALASGARPGEPLAHAFHCGHAPRRREIEQALGRAGDLRHARLGCVPASGGASDGVADLLAELVARGGVVGLFRGRAEIGRRALGHRSILAHPGSAALRDRVNRVKGREPFRPLAPLCSARQAARWFELAEGAGELSRSAYRWMALAARATPEGRATLPGAVHCDGTARIQVVASDDGFATAFLRALGRRTGAEVALNTSLNRQGPIVQTPESALALLAPPHGLDALLLVADDRTAWLAWSPRAAEGPGTARVLAAWRGGQRSEASERGSPGMVLSRSRIEGSK